MIQEWYIGIYPKKKCPFITSLALNEVTSLKLFLYRPPKASHWDLCKLQPNYCILRKMAIIQKFVDLSNSSCNVIPVRVSCDKCNKFLYGFNLKYNAVVCLTFAHISARSLCMVANKWPSLVMCLERPQIVFSS